MLIVLRTVNSGIISFCERSRCIMAEKKLLTTTQKLAAIVNGFDDFDSEMKIGTRVRHDRNSACVDNFLTARFHPI